MPFVEELFYFRFSPAIAHRIFGRPSFPKRRFHGFAGQRFQARKDARTPNEEQRTCQAWFEAADFLSNSPRTVRGGVDDMFDEQR
jgi:hypothetical protein